MLNTEFTVDMAVWQDGVTFQSSVASKPAADFELPKSMRQSLFAQAITVDHKATKETDVIKTTPPAVAAPIVPPVVLAAQEQKIQEIPATLAEVEDLTPFIVSADTTKPGSRLNEQLERTSFTKKNNAPLIGKDSPYNMSDEKVKARETAQTERPLKGPGDAKIFPMNTATRYRDNQSKFGVAQPLTTSSADQVKQLRMEEMQQQARAKAVNETNTNLSQKSTNAPINLEAIRSQVSNGGFGYQRDNLPSTSSEKLSPATAWFPEAMTRQLDSYEAANKVAAQYGAGAVNQKTMDINT